MILTIAIILLIIVHAILIPRVYARVDVAMDHAEFELHSVWFSIKGRTGQDSPSGRFLFFHFPRPEKQKAPDKDNVASEEQSSSAPDVDLAEDTSEQNESLTTSFESASKKKKLKKQKKKAEKNSDKADDEDTFAKFWEAKELVFDVLKRVVSGVVRFFKSIRTDFLDLRLELGLDDAMQTGILVGLLHPLYFLEGKRRKVVITPHFDDYAFDFAFACSFSLRPIQVINVLIIEAFKFPWRRSWLFVYRTWIRKTEKGKTGAPGNDIAVEANT